MTNPVKVFKEEAIAEDSIDDEWVTKADLFSAYVRFCKRYKIAIKSMEAFGKDLKRLGLEDGKRTRANERRTCWLGIRLTPEYQTNIGQQQITLN